MRRLHTAAALLAALAPAGAAFGHVDGAAWTACEAAVLADVCEYTDHHDYRYRGSCRLVSEAAVPGQL